MPEGLGALSGVMEVCSGLAIFAQPLASAMGFAEAAFGIIAAVAHMAYEWVMNQRKCTLMMKRLEAVGPAVDQVSKRREKKRRDDETLTYLNQKICP